MGKVSKIKDPDWTTSQYIIESSDNDSDVEDVTYYYYSTNSEDFDSDSEPDNPEFDLMHQYLEYESILDHQNSIFATNSFEDSFGIFGKYLAQFKTVLENRPNVSVKKEIEDIPSLPNTFDSYLEVNLKEETIVNSCIVIEVEPENNSSPQVKTQNIPNEPKTGQKATPKRRNSILHYFKPLKVKNEEVEGHNDTLKRKRTNEMIDDSEMSAHPAKKALIVSNNEEVPVLSEE